MRSPVHGGTYTHKDEAGVPVIASIKKPEEKCDSDGAECPASPQLSDDAVMCFWLNGKLQNCVLVSKLMSQDIALRDLDRGVYSIRAQMFGRTKKNETFPLSFADTVSFSVRGIEGERDDALPDAARSNRETDPPLAALANGSPIDTVAERALSGDRSLISIACTHLPACATAEDCSERKDEHAPETVYVEAYDAIDEGDSAFAARAKKLLTSVGRYRVDALNPNIETELIEWRREQRHRRDFRRRELRQFLDRLNAEREDPQDRGSSKIVLVVGGLRGSLRCSNFGFNATTLDGSAAQDSHSTSITYVFVTGLAMLDVRRNDDLEVLFGRKSLDQIVLLPGLWHGLKVREAARLVRALHSFLRGGGDVILSEGVEPTTNSVVHAAALFEAAGMRPSACGLALATPLSSLLRSVVPRQFWNDARVASAQCILRAERATETDTADRLTHLEVEKRRMEYVLTDDFDDLAKRNSSIFFRETNVKTSLTEEDAAACGDSISTTGRGECV